jgi:hypothetical protein
MREAAIEAMAQYVASVGEDALELVGLNVDVGERAREIVAEREAEENADE